MGGKARKEDEDAGQGTESIESARKGLEAESYRKEDEAKSRLDEMLSGKKMEFCPRCRKKIGSRIDWAGKCWWEGCEKVICRHCWDVHKFRFCREHAKSVIGEGQPEQQEEKKEIPEEEETQEGEKNLDIDLRAMLDEHDQSRKDKLALYTNEYAGWLVKNIEKFGPVDWTPREFIRKPLMKAEKKEDEFVITISVKKWLRKKVKLSIIVISFDAGEQLDISSLTSYLYNVSRKKKGYKLVILVADGAKLDIVNLVNRFAQKDLSVYLVEPLKGNLYFNISDAVTSSYSRWFNQKKEPEKFLPRLKKIADLVSGKLVVSEKSAMKEFGFSEHDVHRILSSCGYLSQVPETDTFVFKEEKE